MSKLPVFVYHQIGETQRSLECFERQMFYLRQGGFRSLSLSEAVANWQLGKPQPKKSFVLTIDDGYADIYRYVLPALRKFDFSATVFLIPQWIEERNRRYLTWQEIRELARSNFTFGSHTTTHPYLSQLDTKTINRELQESRKIIEDRLGLPVNMLAYPFGDSDERVRVIAGECGYQAACAVSRGKWSLYNIWRVPIKESESELTFYWKARGLYLLYYAFREQTFLGKKLRELKRLI